MDWILNSKLSFEIYAHFTAERKNAERELGGDRIAPISLEEKCSVMLAPLATSRAYFRTRERSARTESRIFRISTQTGCDGSSWQSSRQEARPSETIYGTFM